MYTIDEVRVDAPVSACFRVGADVERWPDILPHYRWVTYLRKDGFGQGRVEMAAQRHFGRLPYPVWWVSEMHVNEKAPAVHYRHIDGVTSGMEVEWSFEPVDGGTLIRIVHDWPPGPRWPLPKPLRRWIADRIIGPVFIHHVATRTLAGVKRAAEQEGERQ